ncbi:hypothetical protein AMAG_14722 [Allomyces macrogynus ATCC 38327]|uniref:Protein PNS1 n=1 Tax=Allomyces macrogynus (strain ATCC 38327) TaxID=578462 RepID=A0A0L0T549_ALLM3|nr:hypothetical protein AMAG_14722 [Allomyces macrogynus ATCC 38327]|eukprot:KNE69875.1 hypothetical protein AMAG_14722 [Allomyces macrogynus ATCC 38327]
MGEDFLLAADDAMVKMPRDEDRFVQPGERRWRNVWAAALFWIHLATFVVIGMIAIAEGDMDVLVHKFNKAADATKRAASTNQDDKKVWPKRIVLFICVVTAAVVTFAFVHAMKRYPGKTVKGSFVVFVLLHLAIGFGFYFLTPGLDAKFILGLTAAWIVLCLLLWLIHRKHVRDAKALLAAAAEVISACPNTTQVATLNFVFQIGFTFLWAAAYKASMSFYPDNWIVPLDIFFLINYYWTTCVTKTVVHVTIVDVFVQYQVGVSDPVRRQKDPTWRAWKRAMSKSFGSICLGSMFTPIFELLMTACDDFLEVLSLFMPACLAKWTVKRLERGIDRMLGRFFNIFAYTFIAISGDPFFTAVKDASLFKKRSEKQLDNYFKLINNLFWLNAILTANIVSLVAWAVMETCFDVIDPMTGTTVIVSASSYGLAIFIVFSELLFAGATAAVVKLAENTGVGANDDEWTAFVENAAMANEGVLVALSANRV